MPITKQAKKAVRQSERRKVKNLRQRRVLKKTLKTSEELPVLYKTLDKAAKNGLIKKGTADRKKSRLARKIAKKES
jgi:small subunit ribosomal protein S20